MARAAFARALFSLRVLRREPPRFFAPPCNVHNGCYYRDDHLTPSARRCYQTNSQRFFCKRSWPEIKCYLLLSARASVDSLPWRGESGTATKVMLADLQFLVALGAELKLRIVTPAKDFAIRLCHESQMSILIIERRQIQREASQAKRRIATAYRSTPLPRMLDGALQL